MNKVVFQGEMGAYGHQACLNYLKDNNLNNFEIINTNSFEKALFLVENDVAELAVIPIENSKAGRVTDVHNLLHKTDLNIIDEIFLPVKHNLWILPDAELSDIKTVTSHPQALMQCESFIKKHNLTARNHSDTAGACLYIANKHDKSIASIGSKAAGCLYNLKLAAENIADDPSNTTRFVVFSKTKKLDISENLISSILLTVKHEPSSLYNLLGIFAQENINLLRLESYMNDGSFTNSTFYVELDGNAHDLLTNKLSIIQELTSDFKIIGTYDKKKPR
jgi:prephenate dehydratase